MTRVPFACLDPFEEASTSGPLLDTIRSGRGWVPNIFRVMLHSPGVTAGWVTLANALRSSTLELRTRELAILLVAHLKDSVYEWGHHERVARSAGVTDDQIAALRSWPSRSGWEPDDWAVLSLASAVASNEAIPDWCLEALEERGPDFAVELAATTAYYVAVAHFTQALEIPVDDLDQT